jgi:hypothetical protein
MDDRGKGKELKQLQNDLKTGLSRREFVNRLKGLGLGFGAAFMLGLREAQALGAGELEEGLGLKSSNPAVDRIIGEGQSNRDNAGDAERKVAATYARVYGRYARYTSCWGSRTRGPSAQANSKTGSASNPATPPSIELSRRGRTTGMRRTTPGQE